MQEETSHVSLQGSTNFSPPSHYLVSQREEAFTLLLQVAYVAGKCMSDRYSISEAGGTAFSFCMTLSGIGFLSILADLWLNEQSSWALIPRSIILCMHHKSKVLHQQARHPKGIV